MHKQILIFVLLLWSCFSNSVAEAISVNMPQKSVSMNDSFSLTFTSQQQIASQPDFSPLLENFEILSNSQGVSTSFINGAVSQEITWNLTLMAKREGKLIVPAITFGQYRSDPQTIDVTAAHAVKRDDSIFLEVALDPMDSVFEQTPLIYSVRLYRSVQMVQAALSEVKTNDPDAIIERLGSDIEYEHHNNGKKYIVFERKYTVLPQRAGELVFSPINFEGKVVVGNHSFFDVKTQIQRMQSEEIKVAVKPIPAPFNRNNWFAANDVKLTEEWSIDPKKMVLGEPLTWTLTVSAVGCLGSQIPDIAFHIPKEIKHYLDKPTTTTEYLKEGFIGVKTIKIALIANKTGEIHLPELSLDWWDLKANQARKAELPARVIQVESGDVAMNVEMEKPHAIENAGGLPELKEGIENLQKSESLPFWVWGLLGLNAILLGGFLVVLYRKTFVKGKKTETLSQVKSHLKSACQQNDAKQAEGNLLLWAQMQYPECKPVNIMDMQSYFSEDLQEAIVELQQFLYGQKKSWKGETLWKSFSQFKPQNKLKKNSKSQVQFLKELYPKEEN